MDLFTAIEKRHSYRGEFEKTKIPEEHLRKIVHTGITAPSGCNAQTTYFIIINDDELIEITPKAIRLRKVPEKPAKR